MKTKAELIEALHFGRDVVNDYKKRGGEPPKFVYERIVELADELIEVIEAERGE